MQLLKSPCIYAVGEINSAFQDKLFTDFNKLNKDIKYIKLYINSPGGRSDVMYNIINFLQLVRKSRNIELITIADFQCSSAAIPIYSTGSYRFVDPDVTFQFHNPLKIPKEQLGILDNYICETSPEPTTRKSMSAYNRIITKNTGISSKYLRHWENKEIILRPPSAIKYNLAFDYWKDDIDLKKYEHLKKNHESWFNTLMNYFR